MLPLLLAKADKDQRTRHCIAWRGNPACLALWLLLRLQITHCTHERGLRPVLGSLCSPGGSKGQLYTRLKPVESTRVICSASWGPAEVPAYRRAMLLVTAFAYTPLSDAVGMQAVLGTWASPRELHSLQCHRSMRYSPKNRRT